MTNFFSKILTFTLSSYSVKFENSFVTLHDQIKINGQKILLYFTNLLLFLR